MTDNPKPACYNIKYLLKLDIQVDFELASCHEKKILIPYNYIF